MERKNIYISVGTVNNLLLKFYRSCIEAFGDSEYHVTMSVLQRTDVFISHCGMNSVNESLYYEVPLVMFPQTAEQGGVARRVAEPRYREKAKEISESFKASGGPVKAADAILRVASRGLHKKQKDN